MEEKVCDIGDCPGIPVDRTKITISSWYGDQIEYIYLCKDCRNKSYNSAQYKLIFEIVPKLIIIDNKE